MAAKILWTIGYLGLIVGVVLLFLGAYKEIAGVLPGPATALVLGLVAGTLCAITFGRLLANYLLDR